MQRHRARCSPRLRMARGARIVGDAGPTNFTTNDVLGLLIEGFDEDPAILMPYNPPYYAEQFEAFGLSKVKDLFAFELTADGLQGRARPARRQVLRGAGSPCAR